MKIPHQIKDFCRIFKNSGFMCYLVGGAVRNYIRGIKPADYDFATDALPEDVIKLFRSVIPTGIEHGTVTVLFQGFSLEVTTFRIDGVYTNSRHPDSIQYSSSIDADLARRDFTINAMALDPLTGKILDPQDGLKDLKNRIIRAIGNPQERFAEDGLRVLRACRFASQLGFEIDGDTLTGIKMEAHRLRLISAERIRDEIIKILLSDKPSTAFFIMKETGVLEYIIPELLEGSGIAQREMHKFDVFEHALYSADFAEKDLILRLSALLHDIGKPACLEVKDNVPTFYNHDEVSADIAKIILTRLKFPKNTITQAVHLIRNHMFNYTEEWSDSAVRRLIAKVGVNYIKPLLKLRYADRAGMAGKYINCPSDSSFINRINSFIESESAFSIKDLDITGNILLSEAGIPKGPQMGKVLEFLLESVLEDPNLNSRNKLIEIAKNYYRSRFDIQISTVHKGYV